MRIIFYRANRACLGLDRASQEGIGFARSLLLFVCILVVFSDYYHHCDGNMFQYVRLSILCQVLRLH